MKSTKLEQDVHISRRDGSPSRAARLTIRGWVVLIVTSTLLMLNWLRPSVDDLRIQLGTVTPDWLLKSSFESEAKRILKKHPLIDGHNDLLILIRGLYKNHLSSDNLTGLFEHGGLQGHVDIPRIKSGRMGGAFWSAFMPCPAKENDYSDGNYAEIVRATLQQLDLFQQLTSRYPQYFTPSSTSAEAALAFKKDRRLISPVGIEGLHQIGNSASTLRLYHSLGARYVTLTWNCHNIYADSAITKNDKGHFAPSTPLWQGISEKGREMVYEMNRLGMLVDLSHVSKDTMVDALKGSEKYRGWHGSIAPPIFSHSSVWAICPHPRNVQDDVLQLVRKRNSVVMINFAADFISCTPAESDSDLPEPDLKNATLLQVVRHIRYIGDFIGYDYVGIGSDFDGIEYAPKGLEDVSKFPDLVAELLRQGVSHDNVVKVIGGNILRVWAEADAVSGMMKPWKAPLEDDIENNWTAHELASL